MTPWSKACAARDAQGWFVQMGPDPLRLPGGDVLRLPSQALAEAIALEWRGVVARPRIEDLPLTRCAATCQHRVAPVRDERIEILLRAVATDALCWRVPGDGASEIADWADAALGISVPRASGLLPAAPAPEAVLALRAVLDAASVSMLTAICLWAETLSSVVLALALARGRLSPGEALTRAEAERLEQEARWGEDQDVTAERAVQLRDLQEVARYLSLSV